MEAVTMIRVKLAKVVDRMLVRALPEDTAAGCCPPDDHYICVNVACDTTLFREYVVHYTCNCVAHYQFNGRCCV
jgi:hypothetical protein